MRRIDHAMRARSRVCIHTRYVTLERAYTAHLNPRCRHPLFKIHGNTVLFIIDYRGYADLGSVARARWEYMIAL